MWRVRQIGILSLDSVRVETIRRFYPTCSDVVRFDTARSNRFVSIRSGVTDRHNSTHKDPVSVSPNRKPEAYPSRKPNRNGNRSRNRRIRQRKALPDSLLSNAPSTGAFTSKCEARGSGDTANPVLVPLRVCFREVVSFLDRLKYA